MAEIFIALSGVVHVYIFAMESLLWGKPKINKVFGMSAEAAEQNRLFAFNQGFYNLFLAIAALASVVFISKGIKIVGLTLAIYSLGSMLAAATVLIISQRRLARAAIAQGFAPLIGLIAIGLQALENSK